ncbi:GntR family transcriptional regulator [Adhaeretor mobilis]|uniref:Bacterial regulatory protein, gntR family n=1 Tax=Adhaeretor mobilis TaxID=1930276 RepID=A0A517MVF9_9BACT|nr:GntR family transcriptional regulator [Adhaeretor mobilis]QDS98862.1 Bacterial regulatory protein, gntR family [Adhaeretor mobilis]
MAGSRTRTPQVIDLAEQLISDIESRELKPGDRYLTTAAASKMLGVGNGVANRALQLLERRQIITRQQRRGAFVANLPGDGPMPPLRRVHFLVHQNYLVTEGVGSDLVMLGMQEELPGVHVQISFLPKENAEGYVADLIDQSLTAKARDGFILVRAPYEVHQLVSNSGVPCVVYGGVYPGVTRLTRIDRDMSAVGSLAMDYLLDRGHKQMAFLSRQQSLPGDHNTMDAIRQRLGARQFLADNLTERFLPTASNVCEAEVTRLLKSKNPPTGFICRSQRLADAAMSVFEKQKLEPFKDVDLVLCDYHLLAGHRPQYIYPRPAYSLEKQGKHIAKMLAGHARGEVVRDEIIPVELDVSAEE